MGAEHAPDRPIRHAPEQSVLAPPAANRGHRLKAALSEIPEILWTSSIATALLLTIGLLGLLVNQPWLFASLGPTIYLIAHSPEQRSATFYNTVVGHLIGLASAFVIVALIGADEAPSVFVAHHLTGIRVLASAVSLGVAVAGELLLSASHPPAAATVLLITLGGFPLSFHSALTIMAGVLLVSLLGEPLRRVRARA